MKQYTEYDKESIRNLIESGLKRDLHMHTYYSDGALSPEALLDLRKSEGYELLAITDHDGVEGSEVGETYAEGIGISFISGIEFDSVDALGKDLHILGYGFDYDNKDLREVLADILVKRARRNDLFMKALNDRGYDITLDDIAEVNEGRYVGKPTFAQILYKKGIVEHPHDAFHGVFREDDLRSITKETLPTIDAIDVIHSAGGLAVMAHPMEQRHRDESFDEYFPRLCKLMDRLRQYGIDGIECYHPSANEKQRKLLAEYADKYGLMITEGSDIHSPEHVRDYSRYHRP